MDLTDTRCVHTFVLQVFLIGSAVCGVYGGHALGQLLEGILESQSDHEASRLFDHFMAWFLLPIAATNRDHEQRVLTKLKVIKNGLSIASTKRCHVQRRALQDVSRN